MTEERGAVEGSAAVKIAPPTGHYSSTRCSPTNEEWADASPKASRPILKSGAVDPFPDPVPTHSQRLRPPRGYGLDVPATPAQR